MRHKLSKGDINFEDIVVLSKPGEQFMWREKTPDEKLMSKLSNNKKGAELAAQAFKRHHGLQ